jgi:hypothetical protein
MREMEQRAAAGRGGAEVEQQTRRRDQKGGRDVSQSRARITQAG